MDLDVSKYIERKENSLSEVMKAEDGTKWIKFQKYNELTGEKENETPATEAKVEELEAEKVKLDEELTEKEKEVTAKKADIDTLISDLQSLDK